MAATTTASSPFLRSLASSQRRTRDQALDSLRSYLSRQKTFSSLEFLKLWKGLFFCMYMTDKPRPQQRLAIDLGSLFATLSRPNFLGFTAAFWTTMSREWAGVDALRMDKFLFLVRRVVGEGFAYLEKNGWENGLVAEYMGVLEEVPLSARDVKVPVGLRLHVTDIFVDELDKADQGRKAPIQDILAPLVDMGKRCQAKSVGKRVKEALQDERLASWEGGAEAAGQVNEDDDEEQEEVDHFGAEPEEDDDNDEFGGFDD